MIDQHAALDAIKNRLGDKGWTDQPDEMAPHLTEWRDLYIGKTPLVARPANVTEVSDILSICHAHGIAVVPQGGNTGLVGGGVPDESGNELLLSLSRMNRVREHDQRNFTITVEAGCVLADIQQVARDAGQLFPLSLAAEGSCQIGGNISTNAGGVSVLKYGNTRDLVLGLEVVLADGRIWNGLRALRKDNTGYDLKQLFIGGEGTLGVITAATLKLFPHQKDTATAIVGVPDPAAAINLLSMARHESGDQVAAFELMPRIGLDFVLRHVPGTRDPLGTPQAWYVLIEFGSSGTSSNTAQAMEQILTIGMEKEWVLDGAIAANLAQAADFWKLREAMSEAQKPEGGSIKHDVSVPVSRVAEFLAMATAAVEAKIPGIRPVPFGHVGDGNIHFNLSQPDGADKAGFLAQWSEVNRIVHDIVMKLGGSISAEHGIGRLKADELAHYKDPLEIEMMQRIKQALDPKGIMNPGRILNR